MASRRRPADARLDRPGGPIGLLPPVLFFAHAVSPVHQADTIDANVYTGYIHFGLILPGVAFTRVLGHEAGYFALVFFFYLVAAIPLYLALRKQFGVAGACTTHGPGGRR